MNHYVFNNIYSQFLQYVYPKILDWKIVYEKQVQFFDILV